MKRAQITIMMIIAILILMSGLGIYAASTSKTNTRDSWLFKRTNFDGVTNKVENMVQGCLEDKTKEVVEIINIYEAFEMVPSEQEVVCNMVEEFVLAQMDECVNLNYLEEEGFMVNKGNTSVSASFGDNSLNVDLDYPIEIIKNNLSVKIRRFTYSYFLPPQPTPTPGVPEPEVPPTPIIYPEENKTGVLIVIFDPAIQSSEGERLSAAKGWNNPSALVGAYISDLNEVSHGLVSYKIYEEKVENLFPSLEGGYQYNEHDYLACLSDNSVCHKPDGVDYNKLIRDYGVCDLVNKGNITEVWFFGGPYFGFYEANMAGNGAWWTNGPVIEETSCEKPVHIMGFNYERGVGEMLENFGHRAEGTITNTVFNGWDVRDGTSEWDRFGYNKGQTFGTDVFGCGSVHYAPNSLADYQWDSMEYVDTNCDDWYNYPDFTGAVRNINCEEWGCEIRGHHKWWFRHFPDDWWNKIY